MDASTPGKGINKFNCQRSTLRIYFLLRCCSRPFFNRWIIYYLLPGLRLKSLAAAVPSLTRAMVIRLAPLQIIAELGHVQMMHPVLLIGTHLNAYSFCISNTISPLLLYSIQYENRMLLALRYRRATRCVATWLLHYLSLKVSSCG